MAEDWFENRSLWEHTYDFMFGPARWEEAEKNIDSLVALVGLKDGAAVLDLCCGPGRYTVPLSKRGYPVTAVDRTPFLLDKLREHCKELAREPEIVESDMREFVRRESFDLVLNMYTSFGYFDNPNDDRRVLEHMVTSLKPGGKLVVDFLSPVWISAHFIRRDWIEFEGRYLLEEREFSKDMAVLHNVWTVVDGAERYRYEINLRLYFPPQLKHMLSAVGFSDVHIYSTFSGEPFSRDSARCIFVATK